MSLAPSSVVFQRGGQRGRVFIIDRFRHSVKNEDPDGFLNYGYPRKAFCKVNSFLALRLIAHLKRRSQAVSLIAVAGDFAANFSRTPVPAPQDQARGQNEHFDSAFLPALRTLAQKLTSYVQRQVIHDSVVGIEQ